MELVKGSTGADFAILETAAERFRVLQLTDLHTDVEEFLNERTRADIRVLVGRHAPDLLAVTGDVWCAEDKPGTAPMWMARDLDFLGSLGVPWAFTWGNHDYRGDFARSRRRIAATPNAIAPPGNPQGHFRIEIRGKNNPMPRWDLFFLNSGPQWQLPGDLDWFLAESERLKAVRGATRPAIVYFHLPLKNYQDAMDAGRMHGPHKGEALCWGDELGLGAGLIKQPGNVRACFCGHDHRNSGCFEEDGVTFAYGRATGYGGHGHEDVPKGATLLELDLMSGAFTFENVLAGSLETRT